MGLDKILNYYFNITVLHTTTHLPTSMCRICCQTIIEFLTFRRKCQEAQNLVEATFFHEENSSSFTNLKVLEKEQLHESDSEEGIIERDQLSVNSNSEFICLDCREVK